MVTLGHRALKTYERWTLEIVLVGSTSGVSMFSRRFSLIAATSLLGLGLIACSHTRNDAQIAMEVQNKINMDQSLSKAQVRAGASDGVVTLSGTVPTDSDRQTAANDAGQVEGVKTVVNNLDVAQPEAATQESSQDAKPVSAKSASPSRQRSGSSSRTHEEPAPAAPVLHTATLTIPEGTPLSIRLVDAIDSDKAKVGDTFHATVNEAVTNGSAVVIPKYADIEGTVTQAKGAGHFTGQSMIGLTLTRVQVSGKSYAIQTDEYTKEGAGRGKRSAEVIGGGTGAGALIGGLTHGTKGALIGAAVGAGAGTGVQAVTHGEQVHLPSETMLQFHLTNQLSVQSDSR